MAGCKNWVFVVAVSYFQIYVIIKPSIAIARTKKTSVMKGKKVSTIQHRKIEIYLGVLVWFRSLYFARINQLVFPKAAKDNHIFTLLAYSQRINNKAMEVSHSDQQNQ